MASMSLPRRSSAHVEAHARRSALVLQRLDARRRRDAGRWYAGLVGASPRSGGRRTAHAGPDATVLDHAPEARGAGPRPILSTLPGRPRAPLGVADGRRRGAGGIQPDDANLGQVRIVLRQLRPTLIGDGPGHHEAGESGLVGIVAAD